MRFFKTAKDTEHEIKRLIRKCTQFRWAVAWASLNFPLFHMLKENQHKIRQLTVGIHFYQTHPDFIRTFLENDVVRFLMNPSGVFHPKLYFFEHGNDEWDCIAGSPNFTHGAFSTNAEVAVAFGNLDVDAAMAREEILATLEGFAAQGKQLSEKELSAYRAIWKRQQRRLSPLAGSYSPLNGVARVGDTKT